MLPPPISLLARFCAVATVASFLPQASALNEKSPGPETFEIKFKLPPPKPLSAEAELATFKLAPGFHAELAAAEPLTDSPIAISWDERGRMFICEMRGYMHDTEGAGEDQPLGRIVVLESSQGDGRYDRRTVFADGLIMPRAVLCVNGGALVAEPPVLWFMKDSQGTGQADIKVKVDEHFGSRNGQPEHMANSPTLMLDNWIYCANQPSRYRFKDGKWLIESTPSRGQWGLSQDDFGRPFYNFNSDFLRANFVPESLYLRNPNYPATAGAGVQILKDQSCWPSHPTPGVNRGYEPKQLRDDGTLATCTATCGAGVYRGALFPKEYAGNVFIPEPAGNLVKRVIIDEKDGALVARNAYQGKEFMTSTDERFRPVNAYTGPDGALYIVDMYRGVIQHKGFLTHYLIANIKDRNLEQPFTEGRIWRIVPDGNKAPMPKLSTEPAQLITYLSNPNGWIRDTAQRLLVEKKDPASSAALVKLVQSAPSRLARVHALWTLEGLGPVPAEAVTAGCKDRDPKVRVAAIRVADRAQAPALASLINDRAVEVQTALAFKLSAFPESQDAVLELARKAGAQPMVRDALLSGLRNRELEVLTALLPGPKAAAAPGEVLTALATAVMNERRAAGVQKLLQTIAAQPANSPVQLALLQGASGKTTNAKSAPKIKILYLPSEAPELKTLADAANPAAKPLVAALDARIAWPNKPGVPPPPVIKPLSPAEQQLFESGKATYASLCAACHQPTGVGMDGLAPPLVDSDWVLGKPELLPRILLHGLSGPVKVNGRTWSLEMPPLGAALSDDQIAGVLTYIRREWEHGASPVTPALVASVRAANKNRTTAWTGDELMPPAKKGAAAKPEKAD